MVEVPIYVEKIVEKPVERIIERRVEVPVEKFVEVPREVYKDKIVDIEILVEKPIYIEKQIDDNMEVTMNSKNEKLKKEIQQNNQKLDQLKNDLQRL